MLAVAGAALILHGAASPASACGPSIPHPAFWFSSSPDEPERFLAGELGVLSPELREGYLYVAYRHLAGHGLDETSRAAVGGFWDAPEDDPWQYDAVRMWNEAVKEVTGRRRPASRRWQAQVYLTRPDGGYGGYFINCLEDAYRTAVETLHARAEVYSPAELDGWIEAQDIVFGNCGAEPGSSPAPPPVSASPLARADRAYQIAAAHFYARDFVTAAERFREIAAARSSPWSDLATYLEARCLIRSSTVAFLSRDEQFAKARDLLEAIIDDPSRDAVHRMAQRLAQYIEIRIDPDGTRNSLRRRLLAPRLEPPLRQNLIDYFWLLKRIPREEIGDQPALDRWILTLRHHHDSDAAKRAARIWEEMKSVAAAASGDEESADSRVDADVFLAPALVLAPRPEPWTTAVMNAAEEVPADSQLFPTVSYHLARLYMAAADFESARTSVEKAIEELDARLSPGDRNRFVLLMAELSPTLEERIELGQREPLGYIWDYEGAGDQSLAAGPPYFKSLAGKTMPAGIAVDALNLASSARLLQLLSDDSLEPALRQRLAPIAWTRAVLGGEESEALALEPLAAGAAPEIAGEIERYRLAAPGEERLFVGALGILRLPGLRPTLRHGFGRFGVQSYWDEEETVGLDEFSYLRDNWWCSDPLHGIVPRSLAILDAQNRAEAEQTLGRFKDLPPAPTHLGQIILGWAETHRGDPRVPEALHRVVRGSRICGGGEISRVAFQTLHARYAGSEWAKKTKYWYK